MNHVGKYILMLEDDDDDRLITRNYFAEHKYNVGLEFLTQSEEVVPYLENCLVERQQLPSLILLDKNAPASGGMEVLKYIKSNASLKLIPVVMISSSSFPGDVEEAYRLGVNSFILKPFSTAGTSKTILAFLDYWFGCVELPSVSTLGRSYFAS